MSRTRLAVSAAALVLTTGLALAPPASAGTRPAGAVAPPGVECTQQSILDGTHFSDVQIAQTARSGGFSGYGWQVSVAVALAESSGWTRAVLINTDCSRDRGLWQINSYWHSEVSDAVAFDPVPAARAAFTISSGGGDWSPWVTYTNGAYAQYMARAQAAVNAA
jgi:hypothetical protein